MLARRQLETAVSYLADAAWRGFQVVNRRIPTGTFHPTWAPAPLAKSWERTSPVLGWPRTTDSLCPTCVREDRARILSGADDVDILRKSVAGEIKAQILE